MPNLRPSGSILKTSDFDPTYSKQNKKKSATFNEINVLTTYHPKNKDYGFMHIDEGKTPFVANPPPVSADSTPKTNFDQYISMHLPTEKAFRKKISDVPNVRHMYGSAEYDRRGINMDEVIKKLCFSQCFQQAILGGDDSEDEEFQETFEERLRRLEFERRRKIHYTEFETVGLARKLIEEEFGDWVDPEENLPSSSVFISEEGRCEMICEEFNESETIIGTPSGSSEEPPLVEEGTSESLTPSHPCYGRVEDDD